MHFCWEALYLDDKNNLLNNVSLWHTVTRQLFESKCQMNNLMWLHTILCHFAFCSINRGSIEPGMVERLHTTPMSNAMHYVFYFLFIMWCPVAVGCSKLNLHKMNVSLSTKQIRPKWMSTHQHTAYDKCSKLCACAGAPGLLCRKISACAEKH